MKKFFIICSMFCLFFMVSCSVKDDIYDEIDPGNNDTDQTKTDNDPDNIEISDTDASDNDLNDQDNPEDPDEDAGNTEISDIDTPDNDPNDQDNPEEPDEDADNTEISDIDTPDNDPNDQDNPEEPDEDADNTEISDIDTPDNEPNDQDNPEEPDEDADNTEISDIDTPNNDPNDQDNPENTDEDSDDTEISDEDTDTDSGESGEVPECSSSSGTPCKAGGVIWSSRSTVTKDWDTAGSDCSNWSEGRFNSGWRLPTINELRKVMRNCSTTETGGNCRVTDECAFKGTYDGYNTCYSNNSCKKVLGDICSTSLEHSPFGETGKLWSSFKTQDDPDWAWYVSFYNGEISWAAVSDKIYYRCVHAVE